MNVALAGAKVLNAALCATGIRRQQRCPAALGQLEVGATARFALNHHEKYEAQTG